MTRRAECICSGPEQRVEYETATVKEQRKADVKTPVSRATDRCCQEKHWGLLIPPKSASGAMETRKKQMAAKRKAKRRKPKVDSADGVRVGEEPVPGLRLRCICRGHQGTIGRIAWSPCGRFIASPSTDQTIRIWDANNGKCLKVLNGHTAEVITAAWSPDGLSIASASRDTTVRGEKRRKGGQEEHILDV